MLTGRSRLRIRKLQQAVAVQGAAAQALNLRSRAVKGLALLKDQRSGLILAQPNDFSGAFRIMSHWVVPAPIREESPTYK